MDEFIVGHGRVPRLREFQKKIERMYEVKIGFEDVAKAHQQWVIVQGENMDRQNAKEYIIALCDPMETQTLNYKGCQAFLGIKTIEQIEKQTNAVIIVDELSSVTITGTDLGVTLAMSSLEELLGQYDTEMDGTKSETKEKDILADDSVSPWSLRLDTSLQRALSQQSDGNSSMTIEDYGNTSATVKRVILHCLNDTATDDIDDDQLFVSNSPNNSLKTPNQFKLPLLMGDEQTDGGQHRKQNTETDSYPIDGRVGNLTQQLTDANISHAEAKCAPKPQSAFPNSKLSKELEYLKSFGVSVGYSVDIIEEGLKFADENTQVSDFIEILTKISDSKSEETANKGKRSPSPDVEVLSSSKNFGNFPPPPPIPSPSKLADMTGRRSLPPEYKTKLIKDFTEEKNDLPIEELKRRNEERQSVLKASFDDENNTNINRNLSSPGQSREKNGHHHSTKQKGQGRSQNKKNKQKARHPGSETPTHYIELDGDEETCVMEPWQDDVDDDCRIVDVSQPIPKPVVVQPDRQQQQQHQQHTNYNRQPYGNNFQQPFGAMSSPQKQQAATGHHHQLQKGPIRGKSDDLRYIVIDGSNVAMTHGNGKIFSCRGIKICIEHFLKRGHKQVTAFVPEWRKYRPRIENSISDQNLLTELKEEGYLVFTPSRRVNGKLISAYDDRFVLELAEREEGVVVSNDQYRDLMQEKASWRVLVEERLLMFTFAGDNFMIPEDPLGQDGPTLDQLLHKIPPHAGPHKRPLSPDKSERGNMRQQQNNWTKMPPLTLNVGNARFPYHNPQQRGLNPNLAYQRPPPQQFTGNQNNLQGRQNQADGAAVFRGAHRGRGQRYPHPQPNKFTALSTRSNQSTEELFKQLKGIFSESDQEQKLREVLQNHQEETDLNRLTNYCMNAIFP
ncbi:NEDD4-binding protein 1-like isoform X2 [Mizuhopecten yessoensis]|uniref:NEDD4-binding protein 1-like isoform X2 n=1 Tax=Mizuhopecten yessoensis TaxID=6573 RepID=UPI000B457E1C|nr:NEDD4-binding protein 1-like isoform X2 [Mizuhopecten yessoensis]